MSVEKLLTPQLAVLRQEFVKAGFDLRFVGGCVRDVLKGVIPKDVDLHTDANPTEQAEIYQSAGVRFIDTGTKHGTYTVVLDGEPYEITSLRQDVETDGRHATVAYTREWFVDCQRRDFTINAMSLGFEDDLMDPFHGQEDLERGIVRFVGDAELRIREDYLRILRWFRFRGRFGLTIDWSAWHAVRKLASGLRHVSRERVWSEISRILSGDNGISIMYEMQVMNVTPHCDIPGDLSLMDVEAAQSVHKITRDPVTLLVSLYGYKAYHILGMWKASRDEQDQANYLAAEAMGNKSVFWLMGVDGLRKKWAIELAALRGMEPLERAILETWEVPQFPITGYDLIKMGMKPGPAYGHVMRSLKVEWADSGYSLSKQELLDKIMLNN